MSPSSLVSLPKGLGLPNFKRLMRGGKHSSDMDLPFPVSKRAPDPTDATFPLPSSSESTSMSDLKTPPEAYTSPQSRQSTLNGSDIEAQRQDPSSPAADSNVDEPKPSRLARLPTWISFWLGYRKVPPPPEKTYVVWLWSFIGAFTCISIIQALFGRTRFFVEKGVPSIGATAVLLYGAIESPLSQPRPVLGGHFVGALTGLVVTKLFLLLPTEERFEELNWLAGSLCCALALVFMQMTGTMHPPAGATALLAAVSPDIRAIGWLYLPVVVLAATIALVVALFSNNMQRRYPTFWWTPPPTTARSFFAVLPLTTTLEKTWTWTSNRSRKWTGSRNYSARKRGKKSGPSMPSTLNTRVPHEDKDWHYSIKNYSKIFGSGHNSRSGSRDSSRTRNNTVTRPSKMPSVNDGIVNTSSGPYNYNGGNNVHCVNSPLASAFASPIVSEPETPMSLSLPASRRTSAEDLHVAFEVQPLHHHLRDGSTSHTSSNRYPNYQHHHPHQHASQNVNYLRYLAMKREGTWSSGHATPAGTESTVVSRSASVDGNLNLHRGRRGRGSSAATPAGMVQALSAGNALRKAQPDPQREPQEHAQQLMEAVTSAMREQEAREKSGEEDEEAVVDGEERWEDVEDDEEDRDGEEREVDLSECLEVVTRKRDSFES